jgi:hypothetical protein
MIIISVETFTQYAYRTGPELFQSINAALPTFWSHKKIDTFDFLWIEEMNWQESDKSVKLTRTWSDEFFDELLSYESNSVKKSKKNISGFQYYVKVPKLQRARTFANTGSNVLYGLVPYFCPWTKCPGFLVLQKMSFIVICYLACISYLEVEETMFQAVS